RLRGKDELAAFQAVRRLPWGSGEPLQVRLVGLGRPEDFRCRLFGAARVWESAAPFVFTRYSERHGRKKAPSDCLGLSGQSHFVAHVLAEESQCWMRHHLTIADAAPPTYTLLKHGGSTRPFRPLWFRRNRRKPGDDGSSRAMAAFRLEFDCAV